ncbi:MAG: hypothetical protein NUV47_03795 [Patescibacteria group bacterium]|nr:hypothetical protein [Patescibacteria group bacterium]
MERKIVRDIKRISVPEYRQVKINKKVDKKERIRNPRNKNKIGIWLVALFCIVFLIFSATLLFSSATVKITSKTQTVEASGNYTAFKDTDIKGLHFNSVKIEKEKEMVVSANQTKNVSEKAFGNIAIYNSTDKPQVLVKNTRFENSIGKIYRIQQTITIPANGNITAVVYADETGKDSNMLLSDLKGDFKIPGFKGSSKYDSVFARLKDDILGGQEGMVLVADDKTLEDARAGLRSELKNEVTKEAFNQKPDDFILFDNALSSIEYESLPILPAVSGKVTIREKAVAYGILFNKKDLESVLVKELSENIAKDEVVSENIESLKFNIKNIQSFSFEDASTVSFSVEGQLFMVWQFSENKLKHELAGKASQYIVTALSSYPGIKNAEVSIRPFWKRSFPVNEDKIKIEKINP